MASKDYNQVWDYRISLCVSMGMHYDFQAQSYVKDDFNIAMVEIKTLSDDAWNKMINKIDAEMQRRKIK